MQVYISYIAITEKRVCLLYFTNLDGCYLVIYNHLHCKTMRKTPRMLYPVLLLHWNLENSVLFSSSGKLKEFMSSLQQSKYEVEGVTVQTEHKLVLLNECFYIFSSLMVLTIIFYD